MNTLPFKTVSVDSVADESSYIDPMTRRCKRAFDLIIATTALVMLLPLFPLIALAIKFDSNGPVLFSQPRIGRAKAQQTAIFNMLKFRTMVADAERYSGAVWAQKSDPRITRMGKFLRKTRLDEIPQLINVVRGDMSLVGPRPERPGFYAKLEQAIPYFAERTYEVSPGITGLAQVNQGYDTCIEDVKNKVAFDHGYALSLSSPWRWLKTDCAILLKTLLVMITGRGQ
ncbi:sugar transferase [Motilimonas eburnea]|uniref:sugar transferase n=1 Tax=Motilimonas eburnea TaxID=1737488 RepID=UPI001E48E4D4|nr:sugar transferase [Motilimonas eburnea]